MRALIVAILLSSSLASAGPTPMTKDEIVGIAKQAMGFSYWWGGGCFNADGKCIGVCKPNCSGCGCPSCSHSKTAGCATEYGADCSGLVNKAWLLPSAMKITTCSHGSYSSSTYAGSNANFDSISKANVEQADVYALSGGGHVFIFDKGDPAGYAYAWECKGCSYGCVHDNRSTSGYVARRRHNLEVAADKDGKGDACDADDDDDGVADTKDNCPKVSNASQKDTNNDGVGDACTKDGDGDGYPDNADNCPNDANKGQADADNDGQGDPCDADDDGDGVPDVGDDCPDVPDPSQADMDGDVAGDACDDDIDGDGIPNADDGCPSAADAEQSDLDDDGQGDACDDDVDGDGVPNGADVCVQLDNADQADSDADGIGDACEEAGDGDEPDPQPGEDVAPPSDDVGAVAEEPAVVVEQSSEPDVTDNPGPGADGTARVEPGEPGDDLQSVDPGQAISDGASIPVAPDALAVDDGAAKTKSPPSVGSKGGCQGAPRGYGGLAAWAFGVLALLSLRRRRAA